MIMIVFRFHEHAVRAAARRVALKLGDLEESERLRYEYSDGIYLDTFLDSYLF